MAVKKENIDRFFDYDVMLDSRIVMIADSSDEGVDNLMANRFIKAITILEQSNTNPIRVILKSLGGCIYNGAAMYDAISNSPCHVSMEVYGAAMSMGAELLQSADERIMQPSALLMLHDGTFGADGAPRTFENWAAVSKKLRQRMYAIFAKRSGKTVKFWEKMCASDFILDAEGALKHGLIDRIAQPPAG